MCFFKLKKYFLTSIDTMELFSAPIRDLGISVSAATSENRGSLGHRSLPEPDQKVLITYGEFSSIAIIQRFFCETQTMLGTGNQEEMCLLCQQ